MEVMPDRSWNSVRLPCFIDEKHSILMNPFVEYIRAAVNLVVEYFSYESMFRYLRCGAVRDSGL